MNKIITILLAAAMCFSLAACATENPNSVPSDEAAAGNVQAESQNEHTEEAAPQLSPEEERQQQIDAFYAEGRQGRTELEFGTVYTIHDGLNMTVTDSLVACPPFVLGSSNLYLQITLENTSDEGIYIRQDGIYIDDVYWIKWGSDIPANIETKMFSETSADVTEIVVQYASGVENTHNASDYVFKFEELDDTALSVNSGNHIYLEPGEQGEYYLLVKSLNPEQTAEIPTYAIITFDLCEFFCDLSAIAEPLT